MEPQGLEIRIYDIGIPVTGTGYGHGVYVPMLTVQLRGSRPVLSCENGRPVFLSETDWPVVLKKESPGRTKPLS